MSSVTWVSRCLDPNRTASVVSLLSFWRLASIHSLISRTPILNTIHNIAQISLVSFHSDERVCVISIMCAMVDDLIENDLALHRLRRAAGLEEHPLGTPCVSGTPVEVLLWNWMNCCLSVRYDLHHCKATPEIPIFPDNCSSNTSWLAGSRSANRSNITNASTCRLLIAVKM